MKLRMLAGAAALAFVVGLSPAHSATLLSQAGQTARIGVPGSISFSFNSAGGLGELSFRLNGFGTIDGVIDDRTDLFLVRLNDLETPFAGFINMGGAGFNIPDEPPRGTRFITNTFGFGLGGFAELVLPVRLAEGINTLTFDYSTETDEGIDEESWSLEQILVTGAAAAPVAGVPEPATWAMMLSGFLGLGLVMRRRRRLVC